MFIHLNVHSEYSFPSGMCRIKELIQKVKSSGQTAVAVTDNGTLYSAVLFYQEALKADIKPIIGCELVCSELEQKIILLCKNQQGYQNLIKLVSSEKPIDLNLLKIYHQGLICLSPAQNVQEALSFRSVFGTENYFLIAQKSQIQLISNLSKKLSIPAVIAEPVYYLNQKDAPAQRLLTCIRNNQIPEKSSVPEQNKFYFRTSQEIYQDYSEYPDMILNTEKIAECCQMTFQFHEQKLPHFIQDGITDNRAYFEKLCTQGMYRHYGTNPSQEIIQRLHYEMQVIETMGFTDYFLIVQDFVRYAKSQEIPVGAGRGSAAGSLCAYCLDITEIDPIEENLLFERFLNSGRQSMPDIDIDFCIEGRSKVRDYVMRRYGREHTAEIIAFDTLKAKASIRDTARMLEISTNFTDKILSWIDSSLTIEQSLHQSLELQQAYEQNPQIKQLLDTASQIEGLPRHTTIHAAGIVITDKPVSDYVPVSYYETMLVTQYTAPTLEELGLLKMDFLGLRNLTIIHDAEKAVQMHHANFSVKRLPLNDQAVYQLISEGRTSGVFQLESEGMKKFLTKFKPCSIQDIMAVLALYRPGTADSIPEYLQNRQNSKKINYLHPDLKEILEPTYGCMLYQEQVMQICQKLAGYSYTEADNVRRAMSKKKPEIMQKERQNFIQGALKHSVSEEIAVKIFSKMERFAGYAFNKSHACAYARIAYQTAYLKTHYFGEYMASLMTSITSEHDKLASYLEECRIQGLHILPPDVNVSEWNFIYQNQKLYTGLLMIKGLGRGLTDKMLSERRKNGKFLSFSDFCQRMFPYGLYKKTLESIIQAGALDNLDCNRRQMLTHYEQMLIFVNSKNQTVIDGQMSLFEEIHSENNFQIPDMPDFSQAEKLQMEKLTCGFYLSGHPANTFTWIYEILHCQKIQILDTFQEHQPVKLICMILSCKIFKTKNNSEMCFLRLEDASGQTDAVLFPETYASFKTILNSGNLIYLTGKISYRNQKLSIITETIHEQNQFSAMLNQMLLCLKLTHSQKDLQMIKKLSEFCQNYAGTTQIIFYFTDTKNYAYPKNKLYINLSEFSFQALKKFISPEKIGCIPEIKS